MKGLWSLANEKCLSCKRIYQKVQENMANIVTEEFMKPAKYLNSLIGSNKGHFNSSIMEEYVE